MKKIASSLLTIILIVGVMSTIFTIRPVKAGTITVPDDYPTIQEAIEHANEGDTVLVKSGTYHEHVTVNKNSVSLVGENLETTIVDGNDLGVDVITVISNNVSITGFTISGGGLHSGAVLLGEYSDPTIVVYDCNIYGNIIMNSYYGVEFPNSGLVRGRTRNRILNNNITCNHIGISLGVDCDLNTIHGNHIVSNNLGIRVESSNNTISGNYIAGNTEGIYINHNEVNNAYGNLIVRNELANNQYGLFVMYEGGLLLNSDPMKASLLASEELLHLNTLYHNNFILNTYHTYFWSESYVWDNGCEGNYWSDYDGTDSNYDGIGDIPYIIDSNNQDNYPLINPYWVPADVNHDLKVDILDVVRITGAYGTTPSDPEWNPHADITEPYGKIDILDVVTCTSHYAEKYT